MCAPVHHMWAWELAKLGHPQGSDHLVGPQISRDRPKFKVQLRVGVPAANQMKMRLHKVQQDRNVMVIGIHDCISC